MRGIYTYTYLQAGTASDHRFFEHWVDYSVGTWLKFIPIPEYKENCLKVSQSPCCDQGRILCVYVCICVCVRGWEPSLSRRLVSNKCVYKTGKRYSGGKGNQRGKRRERDNSIVKSQLKGPFGFCVNFLLFASLKRFQGICMGSGESYKLWIIIQQPQNGFVQEKEKIGRGQKKFYALCFVFFVMANTEPDQQT